MSGTKRNKRRRRGASQTAPPTAPAVEAAPAPPAAVAPESTSESNDQAGRKKSKKDDGGLLGWAKSIAIAFVLWIVLRAVLLEAFHITSGSMEPTMLVGDVLFVNKAIYGGRVPVAGWPLPGFRDPELNEIVIFDSVDSVGLTVVKRVVGTPGDTLAMVDNVLVRNGRPLDEPYVVTIPGMADLPKPELRAWQAPRVIERDPATYQPSLHNWGPIVVPPDSFFMMGDNRDDSYDSRYWGFLGRDRIRGRAEIIYWSYDRQGVLPLPLITAVRWGRLFTLIR